MQKYFILAAKIDHDLQKRNIRARSLYNCASQIITQTVIRDVQSVTEKNTRFIYSNFSVTQTMSFCCCSASELDIPLNMIRNHKPRKIMVTFIIS